MNVVTVETKQPVKETSASFKCFHMISLILYKSVFQMYMEIILVIQQLDH